MTLKQESTEKEVFLTSKCSEKILELISIMLQNKFAKSIQE